MSLIIPANSLAGGGYSVDNSLRFNSGSSDYLNRTFGTSTNEKIWTFSTWFKANDGGSQQHIMYASGAGSDDNWFQLQYYNSSTIRLSGYNTAWLETSAKYRDRSSWYHVVLVANSTEATASNRLKLYVNGEQVSSFSTDNRSSIVLNQTWGINKNSVAHYIGSEGGGGGYLNGYLSESYFIDGQALTPTDFGEFDADSGIWKPIAYTGTYGTNGFFLEFQDSGALGTDSSGEGNTFTVNNLTSIDQTTDTPTNNFATKNSNSKNSNITLSNGNLSASTTYTTDNATVYSTFGVSTGKWYWEVKYTTGILNDGAGFVGILGSQKQDTGNGFRPGLEGIQLDRTGRIQNDNVNTSSYLSAISVGNIIGVALDATNKQVKFNIDGGTFGSDLNFNSSYDVFIPASDIRATSGTPLVEYNFGNAPYTITTGNADANGYGNFEYAVPAGYLSLCTKNLSEVNS
jgi:hypothetical protein